MNTVTVTASKTYDILIGSALLPSLGAEAARLGKAKKVCIVSETTVWPLYGKTVQDSLEGFGFEVISFVFPAGEASKNGMTFLNLLNCLAEIRSLLPKKKKKQKKLLQKKRNLLILQPFSVTVKGSSFVK